MGKVHRFSPRWQQSSGRAPPSSGIRDQHHFIYKDRGAQADSHTAPNRSNLGPTSSNFQPHESFARQHDHCLFLEKLSWMFYLFSYSQKWPNFRENLWEGHIKVLRAFVHNTGHTEHTHQTQTTLQSWHNPHPAQNTAHWNNSKRSTNTPKSDSGQGCLQCQAENSSVLNWDVNISTAMLVI